MRVEGRWGIAGAPDAVVVDDANVEEGSEMDDPVETPTGDDIAEYDHKSVEWTTNCYLCYGNLTNPDSCRLLFPTALAAMPTPSCFYERVSSANSNRFAIGYCLLVGLRCALMVVDWYDYCCLK